MKKLNAYNSQNDREISMMMGKAMCAYANWQNHRNNKSELAEQFGMAQVQAAIAASQSEYKATVRCIDFFVKESIYEIQFAVIESAKEELGI